MLKGRAEADLSFYEHYVTAACRTGNKTLRNPLPPFVGEMTSVSFFEILVPVYQTTRHHIPQYVNPQI